MAYEQKQTKTMPCIDRDWYTGIDYIDMIDCVPYNMVVTNLFTTGSSKVNHDYAFDHMLLDNQDLIQQDGKLKEKCFYSTFHQE